MWTENYLINEIGVKVYREPTEFVINDKVFFIGHGDGLGPGDYSYKLMKKVFTNSFFKWCFKLIHPDIGIRIGQFLSKENKVMSAKKDAKFINNESEWLTQYCRKKLQSKDYNYFLFGHRHIS